MLRTSDIPLDAVLPAFVNREIDVAFLAPTATHLEKSLIDAVCNVRQFFLRNDIHDYSAQAQGMEHRHIVPVKMVCADKIVETKMSIYRPLTKQGDPRLWIYGLNKWCRPHNLLALTWHNKSFYVFNMSDPATTVRLLDVKSVPGSVFAEMSAGLSNIATELLGKLRDIHRMGFVPSVKHGDTCVGMTLEKLLGLPPNEKPTPDYKGIELKSKRVRKGRSSMSRSTLFGQAPDWKRSPFGERKILDVFGYDNAQKKRRELHCTITNKKNTRGLWLDVREALDDLVSMGETPAFKGDVVVWSLSVLKNRLLTKHRETFWVYAQTRICDGKEFFRYDNVVHTRQPRAELMPSLFDNGSLNVDFLMNSTPTGSVRDHGFLFKMPVSKLASLFPNETQYNLSSIP